MPLVSCYMSTHDGSCWTNQRLYLHQKDSGSVIRTQYKHMDIGRAGRDQGYQNIRETKSNDELKDIERNKTRKKNIN